MCGTVIQGETILEFPLLETVMGVLFPSAIYRLLSLQDEIDHIQELEI